MTTPPILQERPSPADVATAFLTPTRHPRPATRLPADGTPLVVDTRSGRIAAKRWVRTTPAATPAGQVLLVHGWEGSAEDLSAFVTPLREAGFDVVAIDLPAHGDSDGAQTSIPYSARAVVDVQQALGALHAVIAHSVGCAVTVEALGSGMSAGRVALLSAPAYYENYARGFGALSGLDPAGVDSMVEALRTQGVDVASIQTPRRASELDLPALFVHSSDDRVVSIADARESASAWRGPATLMQVEGLGHRKLLFDATVVSAVIQFVSGTAG